MKKVLGIMCALALLAGVSGCSSGKTSKKSAKSETETVTEAKETKEKATETTVESTTEREPLILSEAHNFYGLNYRISPDWYIDDRIEDLPDIVIDANNSIGLLQLDLNKYPVKDDDGNVIDIKSIDQYYDIERESGNKEFGDVTKYTNAMGTDIMRLELFETDRHKAYYQYTIFYDNYFYEINFSQAPGLTLDEMDIFADTLSIDITKVPEHEIILNDVYENDFYTMSASTDWEYSQHGDTKRIDISDDISLELWGASTSLNFTDNDRFSQYWANSCLEEGINAEVVCFGNNYFAKAYNNDSLEFVCQNGDYVEFFDFYVKDEKTAIPTIEKILSSVSLKQPKIEGLIKFAENTSPNDGANFTTAASDIIYDSNGITVTYTGITQTDERAEIHLLIENNTESDYYIQVRNFSMNGYMINSAFSPQIAAGKKCNDEISVSNNELSKNGIEKIESLEFSLHIFQCDDWSNFIDSDTINISVN